MNTEGTQLSEVKRDGFCNAFGEPSNSISYPMGIPGTRANHPSPVNYIISVFLWKTSLR